MSTRPRNARADLALVTHEEDEPGEDALGLFTTLARTSLYLDALQRDCLAGHGLAFTEFSVMRLLQRAPQRRLSPSFLADRIVCTTGAMTKLVDRLERAGLVERKPDPNDRRGVLVRLNAAGNRAANEAAATYTVGRERVLEHLGAREGQQIQRALRRLLEALEADRSERRSSETTP